MHYIQTYLFSLVVLTAHHFHLLLFWSCYLLLSQAPLKCLSVLVPFVRTHSLMIGPVFPLRRYHDYFIVVQITKVYFIWSVFRVSLLNYTFCRPLLFLLTFLQGFYFRCFVGYFQCTNSDFLHTFSDLPCIATCIIPLLSLALIPGFLSSSIFEAATQILYSISVAASNSDSLITFEFWFSTRNDWPFAYLQAPYLCCYSFSCWPQLFKNWIVPLNIVLYALLIPNKNGFRWLSPKLCFLLPASIVILRSGIPFGIAL